MSIETTAPEGATTPETMKPELEPLAEQTARADSLAVELDTVRAQLAAAQAQLDVLGSELETKLAASAAAVASAEAALAAAQSEHSKLCWRRDRARGAARTEPVRSSF